MERHPSSQRFHDTLIEMGKLHDKKQADYGRPATSTDAGDPFANVRAAENFGLAPWVGAAIRIGDKQRRLEAAGRGQNLENESIEDTFMDMAVYCIIGLILFQQEKEAIGVEKNQEHINFITNQMNRALELKRKHIKELRLPKLDSGC
jgi:hypothetical protein